MTTTTLEDKIMSLKGSSAFRSGDRDSFQVHIGDQTLPGKFCPEGYLKNRLGIEKVEGRAAVVCPGNCGLMAELRKLGAERVIGFEPRPPFHKVMTEILQILNIEADSRIWPFSSNLWWPSSAVLKDAYEVVIWANGLELSNTPAVHIEGALSILKPGGTLYVEVNHGNHGVPERKVNAWRPSEEAFTAVVKQTRPDAQVTKVADGRLDNRVIYMVTDEVVVVEDSTVPLGTNLIAVVADEANFAGPQGTTEENLDKAGELNEAVSERLEGRFEDEVLDESDLQQDALNQFPEEIRVRIQSLLEAGIDYHVLREAFERDGEQGIVTLEAAEPQA